MLEDIERRFLDVAAPVDFGSLRLVRERNEHVSVRRNVVQPVRTSDDLGVMVTVIDEGGIGYAGTSDLSRAGLRSACEEARRWARRTKQHGVIDFARVPRENLRGQYESRVRAPWSSLPLQDKIDLLRRECERLQIDARIVDWEAGLWHTERDTLLLTTEGGRVEQHFQYLLPTLSATANEGVETQTRTFGRDAYCRQGGLEILEQVGFLTAAPEIAASAVELLEAPNCPSGQMAVVLAPDQMILQIHESIGHPLELDRILGDERNYAGTSFVTADMFGTYRYGSELLNVTFDPTRLDELASYAFDDDGQPARREYIIRDGVLLRGLGGATSQARSGLPGVANARAISWNRPPIDRMANLNLEPGGSRFEDMIAAVEHGVYMQTNCSWSIDDSRNKFQFGCEWARRIENGELATVVKNPNYRGISATFWRNLRMVGEAATVRVLGTPYCGKGEPNQVIRVGHASPPCLFSGVEVFGGV
jgi:predicted Zn-dependent protease